jgi:tetratricopeptide (TPR) repeat protein
LLALIALAACAGPSRPRIFGGPSPWEADMIAGRAGVTDGRLSDAEASFGSASARSSASKSSDRRRVESLTALAGVYSMEGRMTDAEKTYQAALKAAQEVRTPGASIQRGPLRELGLLYQSEGRYAEALPLYERALALTEKTEGSRSRPAAQALEDLALLHQSAGRPADAEPLYRRAIEIRSTLRPKDPALSVSLRTFASFLKSRKRWEDSEAFYKRALTAAENVSPVDREALAGALDGYADLLRLRNRDAEAAALEARSRALRAEEPEVPR